MSDENGGNSGSDSLGATVPRNQNDNARGNSAIPKRSSVPDSPLKSFLAKTVGTDPDGANKDPGAGRRSSIADVIPGKQGSITGAATHVSALAGRAIVNRGGVTLSDLSRGKRTPQRPETPEFGASMQGASGSDNAASSNPGSTRVSRPVSAEAGSSMACAAMVISATNTGFLDASGGFFDVRAALSAPGRNENLVENVTSKYNITAGKGPQIPQPGKEAVYNALGALAFALEDGFGGLVPPGAEEAMDALNTVLAGQKGEAEIPGFKSSLINRDLKVNRLPSLPSKDSDIRQKTSQGVFTLDNDEEAAGAISFDTTVSADRETSKGRPSQAAGAKKLWHKTRSLNDVETLKKTLRDHLAKKGTNDVDLGNGAEDDGKKENLMAKMINDWESGSGGQLTADEIINLMVERRLGVVKNLPYGDPWVPYTPYQLSAQLLSKRTETRWFEGKDKVKFLAFTSNEREALREPYNQLCQKEVGAVEKARKNMAYKNKKHKTGEGDKNTAERETESESEFAPMYRKYVPIPEEDIASIGSEELNEMTELSFPEIPTICPDTLVAVALSKQNEDGDVESDKEEEGGLANASRMRKTAVDIEEKLRKAPRKTTKIIMRQVDELKEKDDLADYDGVRDNEIRVQELLKAGPKSALKKSDDAVSGEILRPNELWEDYLTPRTSHKMTEGEAALSARFLVSMLDILRIKDSDELDDEVMEEQIRLPTLGWKARAAKKYFDQEENESTEENAVYAYVKKTKALKEFEVATRKEAELAKEKYAVASLQKDRKTRLEAETNQRDREQELKVLQRVIRSFNRFEAAKIPRSQPKPFYSEPQLPKQHVIDLLYKLGLVEEPWVARRFVDDFLEHKNKFIRDIRAPGSKINDDQKAKASLGARRALSYEDFLGLLRQDHLCARNLQGIMQHHLQHCKEKRPMHIANNVEVLKTQILLENVIESNTDSAITSVGGTKTIDSRRTMTANLDQNGEPYGGLAKQGFKEHGGAHHGAGAGAGTSHGTAAAHAKKVRSMGEQLKLNLKDQDPSQVREKMKQPLQVLWKRFIQESDLVSKKAVSAVPPSPRTIVERFRQGVLESQIVVQEEVVHGEEEEEEEDDPMFASINFEVDPPRGSVSDFQNTVFY